MQVIKIETLRALIKEMKGDLKIVVASTEEDIAELAEEEKDGVVLIQIGRNN